MSWVITWLNLTWVSRLMLTFEQGFMTSSPVLRPKMTGNGAIFFTNLLSRRISPAGWDGKWKRRAGASNAANTCVVCACAWWSREAEKSPEVSPHFHTQSEGGERDRFLIACLPSIVKYSALKLLIHIKLCNGRHSNSWNHSSLVSPSAAL